MEQQLLPFLQVPSLNEVRFAARILSEGCVTLFFESQAGNACPDIYNWLPSPLRYASSTSSPFQLRKFLLLKTIMTPQNPTDALLSTSPASKTPASTLNGVLDTLNNTLSASSETHVSPILSTLYPPRVNLSITCITDSVTEHIALTFTDAIAILSDAGILGARFIDCSMQSLSYVPARITAAFVGSFVIRGRLMRFSREVVLVWTGPWRVAKDRFVLFP